MKKNILKFILLVMILVLNFCRNVVFMNNFSWMLILEYLVFFICFCINNVKCNNVFFRRYINAIIFSFSILSLLFCSFYALGFFLLFLFIMLITLAFATRCRTSFENSIAISVSILILIVIGLGILNLLFISWFIFLLIAFLSLCYLYKNKDRAASVVLSTNKTSLIIYACLFIVAILGGVGRYVHKWDEYSYWGYAAKVCINEKSLYAVFSRLGATRGYPPVATIWHYIVSVFSGYSEPNLYIGLMLLTFTYMMPIFSKFTSKRVFTTVLFVVAVIFFPVIFNGSINYSLLYVDLLLSSICLATLIFYDEQRERSKLDYKVILLLLIITLLKVNGFVFAFSLLLLFYVDNLISDKVTFKSIFINIKKYFLSGFLIVMLFGLWKIVSQINLLPLRAYQYRLIPTALDSNILLKLDASFVLNFFNSVLGAIDESIVYSFINIPLFVYLIITFYLIYYSYSDKKRGIFKTLLPYVLSYIVFYVVTALSLFVMFSKYEASTLASFGRYLAPINISFMLFALYKVVCLKKEKILNLICVIMICFIGFSSSTFFITDIKVRRDTMHTSQARIDTFNVVNKNTEEDAKVFVINQADDDSIMPLWYARYYCYPRIINAHPTAITWKIKTKENEWDLQDWGLDKEKFLKHLEEEKFEYVFFYTFTDEMIDELRDVIVGKVDLNKNRLYKIVKKNRKIYFEKVGVGYYEKGRY